MAFLRRVGKVWHLYWKEGRKQRSQRISRNKDIADEKLRLFNEREDRLRAGLGVGDLLLAEWLEAHFRRLEARLAAGDLAPRTLQRNRDSFKHLYGWLAADCPSVVSVGRITPDVLRRFQLARLQRRPGLWKRKARAATVNVEMLLLGSALKAAVRDGILPRSPMEGIRPLRERDSTPAVELKPAEVRKILKYAHPDYQPYYEAYALTGARRGELFAVTWPDVDLKAGILKLQNIKTHREAKDRIRVVPLHPRLKVQLRERRNLERPWPAIPAENLRRFFKQAVKAVGLPRQTRIHDLRHAFAGALVSAGEDLYVVSQLLGHRDLESTRRYARLATRTLRRVVGRLRF